MLCLRVVDSSYRKTVQKTSLMPSSVLFTSLMKSPGGSCQKKVIIVFLLCCSFSFSRGGFGKNNIAPIKPYELSVRRTVYCFLLLLSLSVVVVLDSVQGL